MKIFSILILNSLLMLSISTSLLAADSGGPGQSNSCQCQKCTHDQTCQCNATDKECKCSEDGVNCPVCNEKGKKAKH